MTGPWVAALSIWNLAVLVAWLVVPFVLAGSPTWPVGWLHVGVVVTGSTAESLFATRRNPALRARRRRIGVGTKTWDLAWNVAWWPLMASIAVVGGLQHGAGGSSLPPWAWPAGLALWAVGTPLLLRSAWSIGAALVAATWVVLRTALEDATLRRELPGYQDYVRRTPFRLVPGIW